MLVCKKKKKKGELKVSGLCQSGVLTWTASCWSLSRSGPFVDGEYIFWQVGLFDQIHQHLFWLPLFFKLLINPADDSTMQCCLCNWYLITDRYDWYDEWSLIFVRQLTKRGTPSSIHSRICTDKYTFLLSVSLFSLFGPLFWLFFSALWLIIASCGFASLSDGDKDESEDLVGDLRRTESDSVLKKVGIQQPIIV